MDEDQAKDIAARVEAFVRETVAPFERDLRCGVHGPSDELVMELRAKARDAGLLTPHIFADGRHLSHAGTAKVLRAAGLSPLGPLAVNVMAPDEGNMFLLGKVATADQKARFLEPLVEGRARSAFFMTEPAAEGGAGSDPSMMKTTARRDGNHWVINGRKAFITGADGASVGIVMARTEHGATMFLADLPDPAVRIERVLDTIDSSMPGGHSIVAIEGLRFSADQILGEIDEGFKYAQIRLAPARLTHCMRWLGACTRANEIATAYAVKRQAFGKALIDHEGVGFMLADNLIDLKQSELMIDWCAAVLDSGSPGIVESSMTKVAVSEALFRIADRCVQVMGGTGVSGDTIVEQVFREVRAFRIYDGPTEVHKWSLAKKIKRERPMRLDGRVALVTGASSGLGARFARVLAAAGSKVVLGARREAQLAEIVRGIEGTGGEALAVPLDVTDEASIIAAYDAAAERFGPVDTAIANAGLSIAGPALDIDADALDQIMAVNVRGVFLTVREGARRMIAAGAPEAGRGRIVIISSITATTIGPGLGLYGASKAASLQLGRTLARDWIRKGVNVNILCPGYLETELNSDWFHTEGGLKQIGTWPRRRLMGEDALDDMLVYLASDASQYVTGSVITVDDGQSLTGS